MNYGLLNFKAQNGKPGIFWTNEQQRKPLKKDLTLRSHSAPSESTKLVDYKTRKQPFEIRHHPRNYDRVEPEVDNILKPLPDDKPQEPEKVKKPVKNFIQKNREKIGKGKKAKDDDKNGTVTLTQDQLNAILASVGKVASGEEDKLKISIDPKYHEVTIESPRRRDGHDDETEKHYRDRSEKENGHSKSRKDRHKKEDNSIYALMGGDTNRSRKDRRKGEEGKSKWREMVKEETEKLIAKKKNESRRRSPSYSPPRSREGSWDRRRDNSRDRRENSRERRRDRGSPTGYRRGSRSRERRHRSPSYDRRESRSRERQNSRERSRDDSSDRSRHRSRKRSPSPTNQQEDKVSSTSIATASSTRPPTNMTLAEKKKLQWEKERVDSQAGYSPWGKPGAGAPLRTKSGKLAADYRARQEDYPDTIDEESETVNQNSSQNASGTTKSKRRKELEKFQREEIQATQQPAAPTSNRNVPAAMRSSFIFGQVAPDANMYEMTKQQERQQWLKDLERQREEKREQQIKDLESTRTGTNTWADKFTNDYRPARLPEQQPETVRREDIDAETNRISSAPVNISQTQENDDDKTHIRGQNVHLDPVTKKELEDKRQRQLEHQRAVMEQVQEKQRQKQLERERKMAEDAEEERKLQAERDRLQRQFEMDQNKLKVREMKRQEDVERLKAAMDEAHETALREKYSRRMQHLEQGGHDTTQLKAHLAAVLGEENTEREVPTNRQGYDTLRNTQSLAKVTPRKEANHIIPSQVPGLDLDLSPRGIVPPTAQYTQKDSYHEPQYTENRVLTPNKYRQQGHTSEFGTQTGMKVGDQLDTDRDEELHLPRETKREATDVGIMYKFVNGKRVRVKSASKEELQRNREQVENPKKKKPEKKGKKMWNYQNKNLKRPVKQSEKDPLYEKKKEESRVRRQHREQQLLEMVEKNRDIIPTERQNRTPGHSRDHSPISDGGRTPRNTVKEYSAYSVRRARSHSPDRNDSRTATRTLDRADSPLNRKSPVSHHSVSPAPSGVRSPPIPALRHRNLDRNSNYLPTDYDSARFGTRVVNTDKYNDGDPLEIPVGNGDFVPFLRTVDILDPAKASSPMPLSREATQVANARKAYIKGMKPGNYGNRVDNYQDRMRMPNEQRNKDPILNPSLVTDHPTQRQDAILHQLSTMRQNLMQRQRELETFSPTDLE
ncbi:trichohyalin-like isoform X21 [Ostrea edulis]|uniref:trichohyalin-like isoform X21 n=1 Tax=Ostrea edulis TaxID=37623 RepID=UPI0024AF00DF|nr:trichohyalin-like isoform X21 [Ostrea edulis]